MTFMSQKKILIWEIWLKKLKVNLDLLTPANRFFENEFHQTLITLELYDENLQHQ